MIGDHWRGVLLLGSPDIGKTLLAKDIATDCGTIFMNISCSLLCGKLQGQSKRLTRCLFEFARTNAPTTIFIDEIEYLDNSIHLPFGTTKRISLIDEN